MRKIIGEYTLGDMIARYETDESKKVGLFLCPLALAEKEYAKKVSQVDSLIQIKIAGDMYNGAYAQGQTLREGESVRTLSFKWQQTYEEEDVFCIKTVLEDVRGYEACHILRWKKGTAYVRMKTEFSNYSKETVSLELLTSFSLQNISPWLEGDCANDIYVHRMQGRWSEEGRHQVQTMEELQLETSWTREAVRCERFGSIGSMPVNRHFPFLALEDRKNNVFWGVQLETPSSWQMEIYRVDDNIAIDGGIADREFGHWVKDIQPDASFMTPEAIVTVCHTDQIDILTKRLTDAGKEALPTFPASEKTLPILFNEYCTTWGNPSHENIQQILQAIRGKGFEYFVIDCGWYKENGVPWDISMGDYTVSEELFPEGLQKTVDAIHEEGMKAGIWFEIETVGPAAHAYDQDAHFLKRDNAIITTHRRKFWDMQDEWVQDYLDERVIGTLKKYGFDYMKVDYNDEFGIGADGCESQGEKLRAVMQESYRYFDKVKEALPDLILENCASGGHRLEPGYMKRCSMASFSDAHECEEIPIIAANLHRLILPQQSQIWAVIRETDSLKRIAYSVINTFLGRMCISGDVLHLTEDQWSVLEDGMAFYCRIAPVIADGQSYRFGTPVKSMHHPEGWQGLLRVGEGVAEGEAYLTLHIFDGELLSEIAVTLPEGTPQHVVEVYSDTEEQVRIEEGILYYSPRENKKALAVLLGR